MNGTPKIVGVPQLLALLQRGAFLPRLNDELATVLAKLKETAGEEEAKGSLTLKLNIKVEDGVATFIPEIATKLPKEIERQTVLWVADDGKLMAEHPEQQNLFAGPRGVPSEPKQTEPEQQAAGA